MSGGLWPRTWREKLEVLRQLPACLLFVGGAYLAALFVGALLGY